MRVDAGDAGTRYDKMLKERIFTRLGVKQEGKKLNAYGLKRMKNNSCHPLSREWKKQRLI